MEYCRILPLDGLSFPIERENRLLDYIVLGLKISVQTQSLPKVETSVLSAWDSKVTESDNNDWGITL